MTEKTKPTLHTFLDSVADNDFLHVLIGFCLLFLIIFSFSIYFHLSNKELVQQCIDSSDEPAACIRASNLY